MQLSFGQKNGNWKGNAVSVSGIHAYIKKRLKKPACCPKCGSNKYIELTCHKHRYSRKLKNWEYLCRSCHSKLDNKIENVTKGPPLYCKRCGVELSDGKRKFCLECRVITRREWWKSWHELNKGRRNLERRKR